MSFPFTSIKITSRHSLRWRQPTRQSVTNGHPSRLDVDIFDIWIIATQVSGTARLSGISVATFALLFVSFGLFCQSSPAREQGKVVRESLRTRRKFHLHWNKQNARRCNLRQCLILAITCTRSCQGLI